ncbi:Plus-3 domain-containing protein [Ruminococcaceae bacterium YRB3002]|nr:Plus-3 domain-containing protein [Ruminococcaceae bacterium YRB3002]
MASGKVKSAQAQKAKINLIKAIVIVVLVLCVGGFFVYISGILPRLLTGVKIVENAADGTQTTIENVSVQELNYHFYEVYSMYSMYGMVSKDTLDDPTDPDTEGSQTYREFMYQTAADEVMNSALVRRSSEQYNYESHSGAARYALLQLEGMKSTAQSYGYNSFNQYLQIMYGTGFNASDYRKFSEREAFTQEFENYMKQFILIPSDEEIQAAYDNDPKAYQRADLNYYLFSAEMDADGNYTNLPATVTQANAVMTKVNGGMSFKDAVKAVLEQDAEANADKLASFEDDSVDPTFVSGYSQATAEYQFKEEVANVLFGDDAEPGKAKVVETESGTYVVCLVELSVDETPTVTYRTLTIANDAKNDAEATEAQIADGLAQARAQADSIVATRMDPLGFADAVKQNSTNANEILSGGYVSGDTAASYVGGTSDDDSETVDEAQAAINAQLGSWLFDEARAQGDTLIINSADSSSVTIYYFDNIKPAWMVTARDKITTALVNGWSQDLKANNPSYIINYSLSQFLQY